MNNFLVRIAAIIIWLTILGILYFNKSSNDQMYAEKQEKFSNYSIYQLSSTSYITATFRIENVHSEIAF